MQRICTAYNNWEKEGTDSLDTLKTRIPFLIELASASSSPQAKAVIKNYASPVGSWRLKRGTNMWSFGALAGITLGNETLDTPGNDVDFEETAGVGGLFMPVGFDYSRQFPWSRESTWGVFISLLDLGAIATLRNQGEDENVIISSSANLGFEQFVSPGIYLRFGLGNTPFVFGFGVSKTPKLRSVSLKETGESMKLDTTRKVIFLAIDVPLFALH